MKGVGIPECYGHGGRSRTLEELLLHMQRPKRALPECDVAGRKERNQE